MTDPQRPAGVLFDLDGTLVDTCYLHAVTWTRAFREHGHDVRTAAVHRAVGRGSEELVAHVLGRDDVPDQQSISDRHSSLFSEVRSQAVAFPGARELLRTVAERGQRVVIATSAGPDDIEVLLGLVDAEPWIDIVTSGAETERSKPHPDILHAALEQSGLTADQVVFVGDAVWDVEAAGGAGMPCVGLECGGTSAAELAAAGAVQTFADPAGLLAAYQDSALGRSLATTRAAAQPD